jgi:hypothetical protein
MLLLATGLVDELPQIENFRQFYGSTVHNCPYCDGWECRDQPIAVTGGNQDSVGLAIELLLWSKDLVLCTNGPLTCDRKTVETVRRLDIQVIETPLSRLEARVTSWKESGLPTATSSREARFSSHLGSINAHLSRNSSVANSAREITPFSVGKTPRRTFLASMLREMPAVACSSLLQQLPKACRQRSPSIVRSSKRMLQVTRYVTTSPGNLPCESHYARF